MLFFWLGLLLTLMPGLLIAGWLTGMYIYLCRRYLSVIARIFQEKPLFVIPRGQPIAGAEDVRFPTGGHRTLSGCYLRARGPRRGVILFGLEFGSNRWSCLPYCEYLLENGYDVFAFESRGQGDSDREPGYDPLQWVTEYEVEDTLSALAYLRARPDADPRGVGFFGISKGGSAGLMAAARDPSIRCCLTDGAFATYTTLVPYMRMWFRIYNQSYAAQGLLPSWYYGIIGLRALRGIGRERSCRFPHLEPVLGRLRQPVLMIHGGADTYIKPDMARALFERLRGPKDLWVVEGAKHNQALTSASPTYEHRVLEFFDKHLGQEARMPPTTRTSRRGLRQPRTQPAGVET